MAALAGEFPSSQRLDQHLDAPSVTPHWVKGIPAVVSGSLGEERDMHPRNSALNCRRGIRVALSIVCTESFSDVPKDGEVGLKCWAQER